MSSIPHYSHSSAAIASSYLKKNTISILSNWNVGQTHQNPVPQSTVTQITDMYKHKCLINYDAYGKWNLKNHNHFLMTSFVCLFQLHEFHIFQGCMSNRVFFIQRACYDGSDVVTNISTYTSHLVNNLWSKQYHT